MENGGASNLTLSIKIGTPHENNMLVRGESHPCTLSLFPVYIDRRRDDRWRPGCRPGRRLFHNNRSARPGRDESRPPPVRREAGTYSPGGPGALFGGAATSEPQYTAPQATGSRSAQPSPTFRSELALATTFSSRISCCGRSRARAWFVPISTG